MINIYSSLIGGYIVGTIMTLLLWPINNPITYLLEKKKKDFSNYNRLSILHRRFIKTFLPLSDTLLDKLPKDSWILTFNSENDIVMLASENMILAFNTIEDANDFIKKLEVSIPIKPIQVNEVRSKNLKLKYDHL
jgi:hypothetical protein